MPARKTPARKAAPTGRSTKAKPAKAAKAAKSAKAARPAKAAKKAGGRRRKAVPEPGTPPSESGKEYLAMSKMILEAVPAHGAGLTRNEVFDVVRDEAPARLFPGDTHRMWAKQVFLDLAAKGVLKGDGATPERWRRA